VPRRQFSMRCLRNLRVQRTRNPLPCTVSQHAAETHGAGAARVRARKHSRRSQVGKHEYKKGGKACVRVKYARVRLSRSVAAEEGIVEEDADLARSGPRMSAATMQRGVSAARRRQGTHLGNIEDGGHGHRDEEVSLRV
jgi:hypothetical protein